MLDKVFTSASINPRSHCLTSCQTQNAIVYASSLQIVLKSIPQTSKEVGTVISVSERRHTSPITTVKRLKSCDKEYFLTGGTDKKVVLWRLDSEFHFISYLDGPDASIASVCGVVREEDIISAASWADENGQGVRAWWTSLTGIVIKTSAVLLDKNVFALCMDMMETLNGPLLAIGTSKRFVDLYGENDETFTKLVSLAGHSDWIHAIAFNNDSTRILLASAGQDTVIRLWSVEEELAKNDDLTSTGSTFKMSGKDMIMSPYAVLEGHDDWVHSIAWDSEGKALLTASSDKTNIVWKESDGLWQDEVRLGIVGGQAAGFFSATFGKNATDVIASSYFGGLYAWAHPTWQSRTMVGGHVGEVRDADWQRGAERSNYLITVGQDQTTRVFSQLKDGGMAEVSRAQVHGHDLQCVTSVNPAVFVSGAEEKIFRAFRAPKSFAASMVAISGRDNKKVFGSTSLAEFGACVPALGLSNKAMTEGETVNGEHWEEDAFRAAPATFEAPPTEDTLQQNTLWPEEHKLYGHGYEVYAVTVNPSGDVLATACKSSQQEYSSILLWDTSDWSKKAEIVGHQLTVTQMEWNPAGTHLLSVSRDRTAKLYKKNDVFNYNCVWTSAKQHTRIIWTCGWFTDSEHFVTGARDQNVIVWKIQGDSAQTTVVHNVKDSVTAVAVSSGDYQTSKILVGLQSGQVELYGIGETALELIQKVVQNPIIIEAPILRIRFAIPEEGYQDVAICGSDAKLDIYRLVDC